MGTFGAYTEDRLAVARTILAQLGGPGQLYAMVGARDFVGSSDGVSFKIGGGAKNRINGVRITLDPSDTYTVIFYGPPKRGEMTPRVVAQFSDVYADGLMDLFERTTGLYLTLAPRR